MSGLSLYGIGGWIVAGIGVSLILLGVFSRRFVVRRSPQCAKCGYPLGELPKTNGVVICPECGREPQSPTETYTLRRRKLLVVIGVVLFLGALVIPMVPTMRIQGWTAALPMSVQIRMWTTGDRRLRQRIATAYKEKSLSDSQLSSLRVTVRQALRDPNTPMTVLASAVVPYLSLPPGHGGLLEEEDTALALLDKNMQSRQLLLTVTSFRDAPENMPLREARRILIGDENTIIQQSAIAWLLKTPADDEEDRQAIHDLITETDDAVFTMVQRNFNRASPMAVNIAASLLGDDDPQVRWRALRCVKSSLEGKKRETVSFDIEPFFLLINDSDPSISELALNMVEDLPLSAEPLIRKLLRSTTNPETLSLLIHEVIRRNPDPIGLIPALASITRDEGHSLSTRLEAADAYEYIRRRARPENDPEPIWSVYDLLIDALIEGDMTAAFAFGGQSQSGYSPWAIAAIGRRAGEEGVKRDQLTDWLTNRPGIVALLGMLSPTIDDPTERYLQELIDIRDDQWYTPDRVRESVNRALDVYFPDAPAPSAP